MQDKGCTIAVTFVDSVASAVGSTIFNSLTLGVASLVGIVRRFWAHVSLYDFWLHYIQNCTHVVQKKVKFEGVHETFVGLHLDHKIAQLLFMVCAVFLLAMVIEDWHQKPAVT